MTSVSEEKQVFASRYAKAAAEREALEKARRAQSVALRVNSLVSDLDDIRSVLEQKSKGRDENIKVTLLRARNLPIMDFRKSDPYVKLRFCQTMKKSTVKRGELNPTWNESFTFKIADQSAELPALEIDVLDEDLLPGATSKDDERLGRVNVALEGELGIEKPIQQWFTLNDLGAPPSGPHGSQAQIELHVMYYGAEERKREKEGKLRSSRRRGQLRTESDPASSKDTDVTRVDDSKRMILLGHVGRVRNPDPEVRRMAIQALAKMAGARGKDLPKLSEWPSILVRSFSERIEKDPVADVRLDALEALGQTATSGIPEAIRAVCIATKDSNKDVRFSAINILPYIAESGDDVAISAVGSCLEDPEQRVRESASQILPKLSSEFDQRLVDQALRALKSLHAVVRKTAIQTLVKVTTRGAPVVVDGLIQATYDFDCHVKALALTELAKQAGRGHGRASQAVQAVADQLGDSRTRVREAAALGLAALATKADSGVISNLFKLLEDPAEDVYRHLGCQISALIAIRDIETGDRSKDYSPRAREHISKSVRRHCKSVDWRVRKESITTMVKTAPRADRREVLQTLVEMLEDSRIEVRNEVSTQLEKYTEESDKWVRSCLACLLVHPLTEVRNAASTVLMKLLEDKSNFLHKVKQGKLPKNGEVMEFLSKFVTRGDENYLQGFYIFMCHVSTPVRKLACSAVQSICIPGQSCAIEAMIQNFKHASSAVKCDSILTLSKVVLKNDDRCVQAVQNMLSDPDIEVKKVVSVALENMLAMGDSRRIIALASVRLDSGFHSDSERAAALEELGELAFSAGEFKLEGWSVEDADLERFWHQIRQPHGDSNDLAKFVPKILQSLRDKTPWVRRAGVDAIMHCAKKGDSQVIAAVCELLEDSSSAIRQAAVGAISVLASAGDKNVVALILKRLDDSNHLVRKKSLQTLSKIVKVGDSNAARHLMTFLRNSWEYVKIRGPDTDIKEGVCNLLFNLMAFKDNEKIDFLVRAIHHPMIHIQRDRIEHIEDFLISQNLMTRYLGYVERLSKQSLPESLQTEAENSGFTIFQLLTIMRLQRRIIARRKERRHIHVKHNKFQNEKGQSGHHKLPPKKSFQEQILAHRVTANTGQRIGRPKTPQDSTSVVQTISKGANPARDFDWYRQAEDKDAEGIIRRFVPSTIRYSAIALAHQRMVLQEEGARPWEKMRWTKRLRLCEEINGASF